jgi:hypothetical protein
MYLVGKPLTLSHFSIALAVCLVLFELASLTLSRGLRLVDVLQVTKILSRRLENVVQVEYMLFKK